MQSADGAIHLLPALPDAWHKQGSVTGLKAIGGFEIVQMEWKEGKVIKLMIKSFLGGNLRIRTPNTLKLKTGVMKNATGNNSNPFYQLAASSNPIISAKTIVGTPDFKSTFLYDVSTIAGKIYTLEIY